MPVLKAYLCYSHFTKNRTGFYLYLEEYLLMTGNKEIGDIVLVVEVIT